VLQLNRYISFDQGLINRNASVLNPGTIIDFFEGGEDEEWNLSVLEILYIIHILTTFPEYVILSK
jgi:hypothetical protein